MPFASYYFSGTWKLPGRQISGFMYDFFEGQIGILAPPFDLERGNILVELV